MKYPPPTPKKLSTTVYLTARQKEMLRRLHVATRIPEAVLIREGIDLVLEEQS